MKKVFPLLFLSAILSLASVDVYADDDDSKYQYFIACGKVYREDASKTPEEILKIIDSIEENCDQTDDQDQETPEEA